MRTDSPSWRLALGLLAASPAHAASSTVGAAEPALPVAAFFGDPHVSAARLAPDGKHLAMLVNNDKGRDQLGVLDVRTGTTRVVATFSDADVARFEWVSDNRLIYDSRDKQTLQGDVRFVPGLFAVNADGSAERQLAEVSPGVHASATRKRLPVNTFMLGQMGRQDSDWAYVNVFHFLPDTSVDRVELVRVNTLTGFTQNVGGPAHTHTWWLDAAGRPALALAVEDDVATLHYLDPASGAWRKLASRDDARSGKVAAAAAPGNTDDAVGRVVVTGHREEPLDFTPLGFAPDGTLYVISHRDRDKDALFTFDLAAGRLARQPLVDLDAYDFSGELVAGASRLLGVRYTADTDATAWFDPAMKDAQAAVDKLLPGRVNVLSAGLHSQTPFVLVESWSDRQPRSWMLFDRDTGKLSRVADSRPAIAPARMARQTLFRLKARDGQAIPAWVTVPNGAEGKKLPMVVLVHGGPELRGAAWGWRGENQFLAARGYVVLEPEFRGSAGYGAAYLQAGWKQWGLAMQDDVADATRWAIDQGIADPQRICIGGGGYGGYAALMGLVRDPGLYKCGIDWAGVTDIDLLFTGSLTAESNLPPAWTRLRMPAMLGDPVRDAGRFAATSPLKQAARITQPLLLAYGDDDRRVPVYHGRMLADALKPANPQVEWVLYKDEGYGSGLVAGADDRPDWLYQRRSVFDAPLAQGDPKTMYEDSATLDQAASQADPDLEWIVYTKQARGWGLERTRVDFWGRVEAFLRRQIGEPGNAR